MRVFQIVTALALALAIVLVIRGIAMRHRPTVDQRYGCTVAEQMPNGDCP